MRLIGASEPSCVLDLMLHLSFVAPVQVLAEHGGSLAAVTSRQNALDVAARVGDTAARVSLIVMGIVYGILVIGACLISPVLMCMFDSVQSEGSLWEQAPFPMTFIAAYFGWIITIVITMIVAVILHTEGVSNAGALAVLFGVPVAFCILSTPVVCRAKRLQGVHDRACRDARDSANDIRAEDNSQVPA